MIAKDVIKNVATFLGLTDLLDTTLLDGSVVADENQTKEINMMLACCNMVINQVASEYITLKDKVKVTTKTGEIKYSSISSKIIVDILKVKLNGIEIPFSCTPDKLETSVGTLEIEFAYQPSACTYLNASIDFNNFKINSRVLAYGVTAEYCFINGRYDDALVWDNRFKTSLTNINRARKEVKIKQRLWI